MLVIEIDLNGLIGENTVRASRRRLSGEIQNGDRVRTVDISDGKRYYAKVAEINERSVLLEIDWNSEMLPLDSIDSLAHEYFSGVPTPRLVEPTYSRGANTLLVRRAGRDTPRVSEGSA